MRKKTAIAAVAATLITALVLAIPTFFGGGSHNLALLPRLVSAAGPGSQPVPQGMLAGADLTLATDLPDAPAEVFVYRATTAPLPTTPEEALAWARDFGLLNPQVYRDPREPEALFVLGDDGSHLIFRQFGPMGSIGYGNDVTAVTVEGTPLSFDQATEVAVAFLRQHNLLPAAYHVEEPGDFTPRPENPIRFVHIVPELDGHPLMGYRTGAQVAVNPAGEVTYASFTPLTLERDASYPIKSAQEAYDQLTGGQDAGSPFRLDTDTRYSAEMDVQHYNPRPPAWAIGQPVTLTGQVHVLVAEDGSGVRADLMAQKNATEYDLTGPRVAELAAVGFNDVQIRGTVVARVGAHRWQVKVTDWETTPLRKPQVLIGAFTREGDIGWLVTDDGERYRLPSAPGELSDGERIEVWADERPAAGEDLDWWGITAPPASENEIAVSSVSEVVVVVETEKQPAAAVGVEAPVGIPTPKAPFEIGQQVEITGVVHATIFVNGEARRVKASLDVDEPGVEQPPYLLGGPPDVLEAIAQLDRLHVHVRGQVVANTTPSSSPGGISIVVEEFEKLWADEHVQAFLGHLNLETLEGREVVVFTDHETGQRYVLGPDVGAWPTDYARPSAPPLGEQTWIAGVVHSTQTFAGLPVLVPCTMHSSGSGVDAVTSADEIPLDIPQVIDESGFPPSRDGLQGAFVVARVELAYYYEPQPGYVARSTDGPPPVQEPPVTTIVQPVWVFYGHNADDTVRFTAYVQAVVEEHVENTMP